MLTPTFRRKVFFECSKSLNKHTASGDDVFLLHSIKKLYPKGISFALDNSSLTEIELTAIRYRFGLEGGEPKTLSEISALTGYTAMGIQKAEKRALGKLKKDDLFKELIT